MWIPWAIPRWSCLVPVQVPLKVLKKTIGSESWSLKKSFGYCTPTHHLDLLNDFYCLSTIYPLLFIHHLLPIGSSTIWDLVGSLRWLADRRRAPELRNSHPGPGPANDESSTVKEPRISRIFDGFTISWVFHGVPKLLKPANIMKLAKNWGNCYQILSFWVWPSLFPRTSIVFLGRLDCQAASKAVSSSGLAEKPKSWRWRAGLIPY